MAQGFKKGLKGKGGKVHQSRKTKPARAKVNSFKAKSNVTLTRNINRNAESLMIEKASEGKIRLKLAGKHRVKK